MRCLKRCPGLHSGHAMPPCRHTNRGARDWQSLPLEVELICCVASAPAQRLTRDDMKNWTDQKRFVDVAGPFGMLPLLHWTDADEDAEVKGSACAVMRPVIAPHELIYLLVSLLRSRNPTNIHRSSQCVASSLFPRRSASLSSCTSNSGEPAHVHTSIAISGRFLPCCSYFWRLRLTTIWGCRPKEQQGLAELTRVMSLGKLPLPPEGHCVCSGPLQD